MPLLDDRGRLFGKINVIDFLIICIVLIVGLVFVFQKRAPIIGKIVAIRVMVYNIHPTLEANILDGDTHYDAQLDRKSPVGTVRKLKSEPAIKVVSNLQGDLLVKMHPINRDVLLELKFAQPIYVTAFKQTYGNTNKTVTFRLDDEIKINNYKYNLAGMVMEQTFVPEKNYVVNRKPE